MAEYKNPNQQGSGFEPRSLVIMLLSFVLIFVGLKYFGPKNPTPEAQQATQNAKQTPAAVAQASAAAIMPSASMSTTAQAQTPAITAAAQSETIVENELYRIRFSNRGAQVTSWILKKYKDADGQPLDLVHSEVAGKFGYPLSLYTYDAGVTGKLREALYVPSATGSLAAPATLSFDYAGNGLVVHKVFSFDQSYVLHADVLVTQNGAPVRTLLSWPVGFNQLAKGRTGLGAAAPTEQLDMMQSDKDNHIAGAKVSGGATLSGPFDWVGISDVYFGAIFLPDNPQTASVVSISNPVDVKISEKKTATMPIIGAALGDLSGHTQTRLYAGPKLLNVLKEVHATGTGGANGPTLERLVDFGFWGPIAKFLFLALQFVYNTITHSWGWAIVVLTIIINIILVPLRLTTMKSAVKMQRIQPQMDAIKAKYAKYKVTDPKRNDMNHEIMALQKENGVNMFGGCIPTLIQFPLLFAFLTMLPKVVELRQQHWFWLNDLTGADPYKILPIFMFISSFLVQFYTPSPGVDPQQQKMMAFTMPLFSLYITWSYASGLALYWATGNLIMIAQQAIMNRTSLGREMRELAAKRARRKGNVIQGKR